MTQLSEQSFSGSLIDNLTSLVEKVQPLTHIHVCIGCGAKLECDCDYPADLNVCWDCDREVRR